MAVQQNKPTRSKRGMRRSHDALTAVTSLSVDKTSGEKHLRHHITADGFYRGRKVIAIITRYSQDFRCRPRRAFASLETRLTRSLGAFMPGLLRLQREYSRVPA